MRTAVLLSLVAALSACAAAGPSASADAGATTGAEAAADQRVYHVDSVDVKPRLADPRAFMEAIQREYPGPLRDAGATGSVLAEMVIGADGQVREVRILRTSDGGFGPATTRLLRGTRFIPARVNGTPVPVRVSLPIEWNVAGSGSPAFQ